MNQQNKQRFYCYIGDCRKSAGRQIDIERHVTEVHGPPLSCGHDNCNFSTKRKSRRRAHDKKYHNAHLVVTQGFSRMARNAAMQTVSPQGPALNSGSFNTATPTSVYNTHTSFPSHDGLPMTQWPINDVQQTNSNPMDPSPWLSDSRHSVRDERDWEEDSSIGNLQQPGVGFTDDATVAGGRTTILPSNEVRRGGSAQNSALEFAGTDGSTNGGTNKVAKGYP